MKIGARIWLESEQGLLLGKGRYRLLCAIDSLGSINKAAKSLHLSYKKAWRQVDDINLNAREKVVIRRSGGRGGGGTHLTGYGRALLSAYDEIEQKCERFLKETLEDYNAIK